MPTLVTMQIPKPKGWAEFEQIVQSVLRIRWRSPNLTRHGRQGQPQSGADVYERAIVGYSAGRLLGVLRIEDPNLRTLPL
jgi:hypothetical protein